MSVLNYFHSLDYAPAPESAAEAQKWLNSKGEFGHFIGGKWVKGTSSFETLNPATGDVLAKVAQGTKADIEAAVKAARKALKPWQALGGHGRARHLYALARMVQRHARLMAVVETLDNGKTIRESRDIDMPLVARHFYHHAGWAELQESAFAGYEPVGVVGQIVPWNFPALMLAWKIAPALALGNTVVLKPAEYTPLTALLFAELSQSIGLPPGVLNIVTGDGATGAALVASDVEKIAFTGSTDVGRSIRQQTAGSGKALTLELGGKSPFIVFDDADLDAAIEGVVDSIFFNQGQVCCAGSRLLHQETIAAHFLEKLKARMQSLRVGSPLDKCADIGAIINPLQLERIKRLVALAPSEGGQVFQSDCPSGCFYPPTLITGLGTASSLMSEEIFGPVVVSLTFRTPEEAVQLANHSRYGLAASVWSQTIGLALDMAPKLDAGVVWINGANLFDAAAGFGGVKESGYGREGGKEGCYAYLKPEGWAKRKARPALAPMPAALATSADFSLPSLDQTAKLYIGGKQVRPDGAYSRVLLSPKGERIGEVGEGNRKDIRNAVNAARHAGAWGKASGHHRAQVLYYLAENFAARAESFAARLTVLTGQSKASANDEVSAAIRLVFKSAAIADKHDGRVHHVPVRGTVMAVNEPIGVVGLICADDQPLVSMLGTLSPLMAMGNRIIMVPSSRAALLATDFYQLLDTSDVPGGVVNIVTGDAQSLGKTLAEHDDVDSLWCFGEPRLTEQAEKLSIGNLKRAFGDNGKDFDVTDPTMFDTMLREATRVKNIWIPYGE